MLSPQCKCACSVALKLQELKKLATVLWLLTVRKIIQFYPSRINQPQKLIAQWCVSSLEVVQEVLLFVDFNTHVI